jgi:hypothetical protein
MGKLFTAHDPLNVHKTLGGVAVLHALYRLCNVGQTDMGFDGSLCTLACMTWHATLSCSSLIFRIPKHRLMSAGQAGSMIWPEYRLHSILFAVRSLLCMAIVWVEARVGGVMSDPIRVHTVVNIGFVFATLWTATAISRALPSGAAGSKNPTDAPGGTIRDLEAPSWMKTFFSNMQVKLSSACFPHAPISMRNLPDFIHLSRGAVPPDCDLLGRREPLQPQLHERVYHPGEATGVRARQCQRNHNRNH